MDLYGPDFSESRDRFSMILGTLFSNLGAQIGSLKCLNKTMDLVFVTKP